MVSIAIISFAKFKTKQTRSSMSAVMNYAMNPDKTLFEGDCLVSGLNCSPQTVYHEFINTKLLHSKDDGRMYYHMIQSFPKGEAVPPKIAHEMAVKLAEHFKDYEVLICTHLDRDHVHSHFIINSVSFETGRKFHISTPELEPIRLLNDALCMEYGFEICKPKPKSKQNKSMGIAEYHAAVKGESWKMRLMNTIDSCMKHAVSKTQFIELMGLEGYSVKWTDSRKSITYTTPLGVKCRDDRLHEAKYLKGRMELELRIREEIILGRTQTAEQGTVATAAEPQPADTGKTGQSVLQSTVDFRLGNRCAEADGSPATATPQPHGTNRIVTHQTEQPAHTGGHGEYQPDAGADSADALTGWEAEWELLFHPELALGEDRYQTDVAVATPDIGSVMGDVVRLGKAMERLGNAPPVNDATTNPLPHSSKKKKLAVGQKEDDHSGYDFEMKM